MPADEVIVRDADKDERQIVFLLAHPSRELYTETRGVHKDDSDEFVRGFVIT